MTIEFKHTTSDDKILLFALLYGALIEEINDCVCINAHNAETEEPFTFSIERKDLANEEHTEDQDIYTYLNGNRIEITIL